SCQPSTSSILPYTTLFRSIQSIKDKSFLKAGNPFDLDVIKAERERIDEHLKNKGFYYFGADNIVVQADSTVTKDPKVELIVKLKDRKSTRLNSSHVSISYA